jgi:NTP pyrophosphatase (non-canonical NTP hydrolase)
VKAFLPPLNLDTRFQRHSTGGTGTPQNCRSFISGAGDRERRDRATIEEFTMKKKSTAQIVLFPGDAHDLETGRIASAAHRLPKLVEGPRDAQVVLSGSYRKDIEGLKRTYETFKDLRCQVLSPSNIHITKEVDGFVFMEGEDGQSPDVIETRHLDAIQRSQFMWLHSPSGYVGTSAALEVGFAHALGIPVFCQESPTDLVLQGFVTKVDSPEQVVEMLWANRLPIPRPAVSSFQHYYRRVAIERGYWSEGARDCLLLMIEEVGELARSIRKDEGLIRHGHAATTATRAELADVFLYVVHMANIFGIDLSNSVQEKEMINLRRFLSR